MLKPVTGSPGHWRDPTWNGTSPGTFAIVIGCSRYWHLNDGSDVRVVAEPWMREAQGLGQLYVSALTGKRFFDWMRAEYSVDQAPLVSCRLLLSETAQELKVDPELATHQLEPTFPNCSSAIAAWVNEVNALQDSIREQSRLIFFFSGHGLQSTIERQILLPCDYLGDAAANFNYAISTENLVHGLDRIAVPYRYYFVDACRNDTREIREMRPTGREILPVYPSRYTYRHKKNDAVLFATTASLQAWQPTDPALGPSLFGQALLDGLRGTPEIELTEKDGRKAVEFFKLESYVNARIAELLKQHQSLETQRVEPGGTPRPEIVTELPSIDVPGARQLETTTELVSELSDVADFAEPVRSTRSSPAPASSLAYAESTMPSESARSAGWPTDYNSAHHLFGHETTTELFLDRMQVAAMGRKAWLPNSAIRLLRVDRSEAPSAPDRLGRMRYRMLVSIDDQDKIGHWLQFADQTDAASGVMLAQDHSMHYDGSPEYLLHVELVDRVGPKKFGLEIVALEGAPHAVGSGPVARATAIWRRYRANDAQQAVREYEGSELEMLVRGKLESPLAATIAALVLLRANRLDLLHNWMRNTANQFPQFSDGAVLWAEQVWRQSDDRAEAVSTAIEYLSRIPKQGLPVTEEALSYASSLLYRLKPDLDEMSTDARATVDSAHELVEQALPFVRGGGLFTSFAKFRPDGIYRERESASRLPLPVSLEDTDPIEWVENGLVINGIYLERG